MVIHIATALLQPTLTDEIRYSGGAGHIGWPPTLLATLANALAMASLMVLATGSVRRTLCSCSGSGPIRSILFATALDFSSGCLLTTGLLMLGSGIFVVIYSSTTVWTALWARCSGQVLAPGRWAGVVLVTIGMVLGASSNFSDAAGDSVATTSLFLGCAATLLGTMLHAAMFVYSEIAIKQAGIELLLLCASMGTIETCLLVVWNAGIFSIHGVDLYLPADPSIGISASQLALLYACLTSTNAIHAWSFFNMLDKVGAVTSVVMKGLQLVLVFAFSVVYFCKFQSSRCFAWSKAAGVSVVVVGLLVYAYSTSHASSIEKRRLIH